MDQKIDPRQQKNKPMFDVIEPSMVRAQFVSKRDISFSSYLKPHNNRNHNHDHDIDQSKNNKFVEHVDKKQNKTEEPDQISIFDAAKYFSGLHDNQQQREQCTTTQELDVSPVAPRLSSVSSSVETISNYGGRNSHSSYRTRSFHATPTASSEASWNSQTGLLANPPGSVGISIIKSFSNNSSGSRGTNHSNSSTRWPRISTKWLNISRRKCPCLGKKSVQVEERIDSKTVPRMVDLRQNGSNSSNVGTNNLYSPRQSSPKSNFGTTLPVVPQESRNSNSNLNLNSNFNLVSRNPIDKIGFPCNDTNNNNDTHSNGGISSVGLSSKVVGPLRLYDDLGKVGGGVNGVQSTNIVKSTTTTTTTSTSNGFTFPILENTPIGVKKMFNVIPPNHHNNDEPHRDSLEVFQPRSHPSPKSRRTSYEDENVSDGSSDLFEIESFSTSTYPYRDSMEEVIIPCSNFGGSMMNKRLGISCPSYYNNNQFKNNNNNVDDENGGEVDDEEPMTPSVAQTDCYAPSEVSIDWSVTTAEGFDRGSLSNFSASASDFAYAAMRREAEQYRGNDTGGGGGGGGGEWHNNNNIITNSKGSGKNSGSGGGGGMLLGCRNEKAISVGPNPIKSSGHEGPPGAARHVGGRGQGVRAAHVNGVVGRSRSSILV